MIFFAGPAGGGSCYDFFSRGRPAGGRVMIFFRAGPGLLIYFSRGWRNEPEWLHFAMVLEGNPSRVAEVVLGFFAGATDPAF